MPESLTAAVTAAIAVLAAVLVHAGAVKVRRPASVTPALARLGVPGGRRAAVAVGALEGGVGVLALVAPGRGAALLTAAYAGLLLAAWRLRRSGADCGCFGPASTTVSRAHVLVDGAGVLAGVTAVLVRAPAPVAAAADDGVAAVVGAAVATTAAAWAVALALTAREDLRRAREGAT